MSYFFNLPCLEESKLIKGKETPLPRTKWPQNAISHPIFVSPGHLVIVGIFTNLPFRWNCIFLSCQKAGAVLGFQEGLSSPRWEYTDILITLERLSKPRCRALASATSPERFIAHKSCSWLIKQCWSEPKNHENINCSLAPFSLTRVCCCFCRGRVRGVIVLNVAFTLARRVTLLDTGIFCAKKHSVFSRPALGESAAPLLLCPGMEQALWRLPLL